MAAALEHVTERDDVVAQVGVGRDQRIAHPRLRGQVHDLAEPAVAKQRRGRRRIGQVQPLEGKPRAAVERGDARLLERDVVVRLEVVDAHDLRTRVEQRTRRVHADEAGGPCDQHATRARHACRSPTSSARSLRCFWKLAKAPIAMCANPAAPSRKPRRST